MLPILQILQAGETVSNVELTRRVREQYFARLSPEALRHKTKNGRPTIDDRILWGRFYLKMAKMVEQPARGMVKITAKGLPVAQGGKLTLQDLRQDPDFLAHQAKQKTKLKTTDHAPLESSPQDLVDEGIQKLEEETKIELLDRLKTVDPYYFERVILRLFHKMGYGDFLETSKSGDGGIDGIINQDQLGLEKIFVQTKRYTENKVRETDIRNFIGAMSGDTQKGIFVTTSEFDDKAQQKAESAHHTIILIDGTALVDLMYTFGVGVQVKDKYEIKAVDEDFFEDG